MKIFLIIGFILLISCDSKTLSEEERKKVQKELKSRKPVKITDEELLNKSFEIGRSFWKDTSNSKYQWKIYQSEPEEQLLKGLWEAYAYSAEQGSAPEDNVQLGDKYIYYSRPLVENDSLRSMMILALPKKDVVLEISYQHED